MLGSTAKLPRDLDEALRTADRGDVAGEEFAVLERDAPRHATVRSHTIGHLEVRELVAANGDGYLRR